MTHLLYHQVQAHSALQDGNTSHGDVNPNIIFRDNKGDFKILVKRNLQPGVSNERKQLEKLQKGEPLYVSPQIYKALKRN